MDIGFFPILAFASQTKSRYCSPVKLAGDSNNVNLMAQAVLPFLWVTI
jgi:hypothetical protein